MQNQKPDSKNSNTRKPKPVNSNPGYRSPPEWVNPATKSIIIPKDNKTQDILVLDDKEDTIEEEIENEMNVLDTPQTQKTPIKMSDEEIKNNIVIGQEDIPFTASLRKRTSKED